MSSYNRKIVCSFCGKTRKECKKIIAGKTPEGELTFICDLCAVICYEAIKSTEQNIQKFKILKPNEIYEKLNEYIEGQETAKKLLSIAGHYHCKRISLGENLPINLDKSNILLVGPSGSGKTHIVEALSKILDIPFAKVDATTCTSVGYVGEDIKTASINGLLKAADYKIDRAKIGIVFIDEIDKLRKYGEAGTTKDISGEGVQHELLQLLSGDSVSVSLNNNKKSSHGNETINFETKNVLFICAGAFEGIERLIQRDLGGLGFLNGKTIDFNSYNEVILNLTQDHLVKYGMIRELIGRIPVVVPLQQLTENELMNILTKPKNAILQQFKFLLKQYNCYLSWTDEGLKAIAHRSIADKTNARKLRAEVEKVLQDALFHIPNLNQNSKLIIDDKAVENGKAEIVMEEEEILTMLA